MSTDWWKALYESQHQIWPEWARRDGNAEADAAFVFCLAAKPGGGTVLDLGCGSGRLACAMAQQDWRVHGVDISPDLTRRAERRAADKRLAERVTFETADFREVQFSKTYDLVVFWDSVLAIWPLVEARPILHHVLRALAPNGVLILQQLAPEYFQAQGPIDMTIEDASVGPGKTHRRYDFDITSGVLSDKVVHVTTDGAKIRLPTQTLHLLHAKQVIELFQSMGLKDVRAIGSEGWKWGNVKTPVTALSPQYAVMGTQI